MTGIKHIKKNLSSFLKRNSSVEKSSKKPTTLKGAEPGTLKRAVYKQSTSHLKKTETPDIKNLQKKEGKPPKSWDNMKEDLNKVGTTTTTMQQRTVTKKITPELKKEIQSFVNQNNITNQELLNVIKKDEPEASNKLMARQLKDIKNSDVVDIEYLFKNQKNSKRYAIAFHKRIDSILQNRKDETQVLLDTNEGSTDEDMVQLETDEN